MGGATACHLQKWQSFLFGYWIFIYFKYHKVSESPFELTRKSVESKKGH